MTTEGRSVLLALLLLAPPQEFHQGVDYVIEAKLDETNHVLTGRAELRYTNRSQDRLDTLFFHLHLNAFRPNSAWAQRELQVNRRRFQDLGPEDHAFDRVHSIAVDGRGVTPRFPLAPDSTVMAVPLPRPIRPGGVATVTIDWTARLSTVPRRQGRRGRHYDWAHWYPRIAVYDTAGWQINPLLPQGEFFGEFASYDVTLDLAADQVMAATGVPVSGDPGWSKANATPDHPPVLKRDAYRARPPRPLGLLRGSPPDRKRIRWIAQQVHHFAWTADPEFIYEGSQLDNVALHALYLPGDQRWPTAVLKTMASAVRFYTDVFGPYVYPQLTAARRVDTGGTEFPMITMNEASPPIVHETGHQWAHAILANNEFREFWLDEGLVHYLGDLYAQANGGPPASYTRIVNTIAQLDSVKASQPVAIPADQFSSFALFQTMSYFKAALVLRMLRWYMGDAEFRKGLRLYYERNRLQHVDENDLRRAMSYVADEELDWFFEQWLHTTATLDYAIVNVATEQLANGRWRTQVEITRTGDIWMPVDLAVGEHKRRVDSRERAFAVVIESAAKPAYAELDPDALLIDVARSNNRFPIMRVRKD